MVECTVCGLGFIDPLPTLDEVRGFYPDEYYGNTEGKFSAWIEWLVRVIAARRAWFLIRQVSGTERILDVGCGRGTLLSAFANRGFEVHGFELSEVAAAIPDKRAEVRFGGELSEARYPPDHFDLIVMWHVLEHLRHPDQTIQEIHRILKPGGTLVVAVPNFSSCQARWAKENWFHLDLPRHLYHFPLTGLRKLVEDRGFAYRSGHHFSLRQNPFGWVQSAMNRFSHLPRNGIYSLLLRSSRLQFSLLTRAMLLVAFVLGMPFAVLLSIMTATFRHGATVHGVWRKVPK